MSRIRIQKTIVLYAGLALMASTRVEAQCVGSLTSELAAFDAMATHVTTKTFPAGGAQPWNTFISALRDDGAYYAAMKEAGLAGPCILSVRDTYRNAVEAALSRAVPNQVLTNKEAELRAALREGAATALATRYAPSDRFGVFFGFGMSVIQHKDDFAVYKVISRRGVGTDTSTKQYIVQESNSQALPIATTGLSIRFRERNRTTCGLHAVLRTCSHWLAERVWPTSLFGALQFGGGEGTVSGTTLGIGWRLVGDVNLLLGYGIARLPTLRTDIGQAFAAEKSGVLQVPPGESAESIMGTQSQQAFTITLGIPLALRNALGGK